MAVTPGGAANAAPQAPAAGRAPKKRAAAVSQGPQLEFKANFCYLAHPARYDVFITDRGPEILPALTTLEYQPGLAGVLPVKGEANGDPSFALAAKKKKGWIEVPEDFVVEAYGERRAGYVQVYDSKHGPETHHVEVWQRPYVVGSEIYWDKDPAGYWQFLRDVKEKLLPPVDNNVLRALQSKLQAMKRTAVGAKSKGSQAAGDTITALDEKLKAFGAKGQAGGTPLRGSKPKAPPSVAKGGGDDDGGDDDDKGGKADA
jgi:hypothetical protein